jgi:hypothetical protein
MTSSFPFVAVNDTPASLAVVSFFAAGPFAFDVGIWCCLILVLTDCPKARFFLTGLLFLRL